MSDLSYNDGKVGLSSEKGDWLPIFAWSINLTFSSNPMKLKRSKLPRIKKWV